MSKIKLLLLSSCFLSALASTASYAKTETEEEKLSKEEEELLIAQYANADFDELISGELYSASKRPEKIFETPAAASVISSEEIARSGATNIPDILRLVPGVQVAQINANNWAVSIRGFNEEFSNKLLVLVDGRAVYTPLFSGVFWGDLDYLIADIDRIEVIRGSGGTLWGANAVNGVINIITKEARKTVGNYASATVGLHENMVEFRNGINVKEYNYLKTYGKFKKENEYKLAGADRSAEDEWNRGQAGFRYDFMDKDTDPVTIQGDYYYGKRNGLLQTPISLFQDEEFSEDSTGGNLMFGWKKPIGNLKNELKAYIDYQYRDSSPIITQEQITYNIDYQGNYDINRHSFTGGFGYRLVNDNLNNTSLLSYNPESSDFSVYNAFLQDKIDLYNNKLFFTLGSKVEYNDYTEFNVQPNARLLYQISEKQSVWGAASKAIRTPSRGFVTFQQYAVPNLSYGDAFLIGNVDQKNEKLHSYEVGYRQDITKNFYLDTTAFYNKYSDLESYETISGPAPYISIAANNGSADNFGIESYAYAKMSDKWDLRGGVTLLAANNHIDPSSNDTSVEQDERRSPKYQFTISSNNKLTDKLSWNNSIYYNSNISYYDVNSVKHTIDSYARVDTVFNYKYSKQIDFSLFGRNLTDNQHQEFDELFYATPSEIPTTFGLTAKYKF